ncbi:MAG: alpha-ribazole phosphatase [Anaerolineales bacterium]|nr:alpha-ribazole phosphatase [Anaerolineales bacterium]
MRLLLVRHGETAYNAQGRYQGQTDLPLNQLGRQQAALLASRLAGEEIHAIYTSDLRRAAETAALIAVPHRLSVHGEPRLREMSFGAWERLTYAEISERDPQALAAWQADPLGAAPPGGESLAELAARVQSAFDSIVALYPEQTVLLVAHGGPLRVLLCLALGLPPEAQWRFRLDTASLSELCCYTGDAILMRLNDTHHLSAQPGHPRERRHADGEPRPRASGEDG